ncbi:MAG: GAF domain-containing protein [Xanthomonadales bacterium]|nr:GAF domain-containing protein [Xanthomonadales bacterium]
MEDRWKTANTLAAQARGLLSVETDVIANAANLSALLFMELEQVNWVGFYLLKGNELVLGPFQGKPACVRITLGQGVCGTAAETHQTQRVADVELFSGHIACDAASRSELVVPLIHQGKLLGVLDIDSPVVDRFSASDQVMLEEVARVFLDSIREASNKSETP